jgi:hypothetical protein
VRDYVFVDAKPADLSNIEVEAAAGVPMPLGAEVAASRALLRTR